MTRLRQMLSIVLISILAGAPLAAQDTSAPAANGGEQAKSPMKMMFEKEIKPIKIEFADEPAVVLQGVRLTIGDAIKVALDKNYTLLAEAYSLAMVDTVYQQIEAKYAIYLNADGGVNYGKYTGQNATFNGKEKTGYDVNASLSKTFSSGTTVFGGLKHSWADSKRDPFVMDFSMLGGQIYDIGKMFGPAQAYSPIFFVGIKQELLQNAFGMNDRNLERRLKNVSLQQREALLSALSLVVVGVVATYWNLVQSSITVSNLEVQVDETRKVRNITARNVGLGLSDDFQLNYYNAILAGTEAQLVSARNQYRSSLRDFLTALNLDENSEMQGVAYFTNTLPDIDIDKVLKVAYERRADYKIALLELENAKIELKTKYNESLPSLTLEGNANFMAQDADAGKAYKDVFTAKYPMVNAKLSVSYPLNNKTQETELRNARFNVKKTTIELDRTKRTVKDNLVGTVDNIYTAYAVYQKAREAREQSELSYNRMLGDLRRGRLNSSIVKDGLVGLLQSRQQELGALVGFNLLLLQFDVAKNDLFVKYKIDVDRYIPKK